MRAATTSLMFSSASGEWETPQDFFEALDKEFHFTLDGAASHSNAKCNVYCTQDGTYLKGTREGESRARISPSDGLLLGWDSAMVWLNPPYGRGIGSWIAKAASSASRGATVVCLLPARTDTRWFHTYCLGKTEIRFIKGRLKFGGSKSSAPFPSMIVVFRPVPKPPA